MSKVEAGSADDGFGFAGAKTIIDENGNPIYPPFNPTPLPIFDTKERAELKEIMLEALREYHGEKTHPTWTLDQFQE